MEKQADSLGKRLKKARDKKGLSLDDVYQKTRIHPKILESLEDSRAEDIVNDVYKKAFLKNYAQYLGLHKDDLITNFISVPAPRVTYKDDAKGEGMAPKVEAELETEEEKESPVQIDFRRYRRPFVLSISILLAVWLLMFLGIKMVQGLRGIIEKTTVTLASNKEIASEEAPVKPTQVSGFKTIPPNEKLVLELRAIENLWVEVKSDNTTVFRRILPKGSSERWNANNVIELWLGKAEAAEITLNGRQLRSPGKGVIRGILLTREGMSVGKK